MTTPLLIVSNLAVRYGDFVGIADASLIVPAGSAIALLGYNGAGKQRIVLWLETEGQYVPAAAAGAGP
jgi:ABC-type branched-subunit amino acid transport system ATPase component